MCHYLGLQRIPQTAAYTRFRTLILAISDFLSLVLIQKSSKKSKKYQKCVFPVRKRVYHQHMQSKGRNDQRLQVF